MHICLPYLLNLNSIELEYLFSAFIYAMHVILFIIPELFKIKNYVYKIQILLRETAM